VQAFAFDDVGSFVIVQSPANSAVVDLDRTERADLLGLMVLDVTTTAGRAYLLGRDTTVIDGGYNLVELDLATLATVRTARFAVTQPAGALDHMRVLVTPRRDVYAYVAVQVNDGKVPIRSELVAFDSAFAPSRIALPNDLGLDATVGADGALYLFGGPARNVVTRVDPLTRDLTRYAVAPDGTFVRTLVAR
jgi:hypothetical protein